MGKILEYKEFMKNQSYNPEISVFFGKLFQSRDITHLNHLSSASYAEHKALNKYYDNLLDAIDTLIENFQGYFGIVPIVIPESKTNYVDSITHLTELKEYIEISKGLFKNSDILNNIDEILTIINSTIYKLENLK